MADSSYFTVSGIGIGSFDAVDMGLRTDVILSGVGSGKLIRYSLSDGGVLSKEGKIDLPGATTQNHDALLAVSLNNGNSAVYTVEADTGALTRLAGFGCGCPDRRDRPVRCCDPVCRR